MAYKVLYENIVDIDKNDAYVTPPSRGYDYFDEEPPINYATFETDGFLLDDKIEFADFGDNIGYVSDYVADEDSTFYVNPILGVNPVEYGNAQTTSGITLYFFRSSPKEIVVEYVLFDDSRTSYNYILTDAERTQKAVFLPAYVENWTHINITITRGNPNEFVKIYGIRFGNVIELNDFKSFEIHKEIKPASDDLPFGTLSFEAIYNGDKLVPQKLQKLTVYSDDELIGRYYLDSVQQKNKNSYSFEAFDSIGVLDNFVIDGDLWDNLNYTSPSEIVKNISETSKISIVFRDGNGDETLFGRLTLANCRYALQQICFAFGYKPIVLKNGTIELVYYNRSATQSETIPLISSDRILGNALFKQNEVNLGYEVSYTDYFQDDIYQSEWEELLKTEKSSKNTKVPFDKPVQQITDIQVGDQYLGSENFDAALSKWNKNYIIPIVDDVTVWGYFYKDVENIISYKRDDLPKNSVGKIKKYETMSVFGEAGKLGFPYGLDQLNQDIKSKGVVSAKIILQNEQIGDIVVIETAFNGLIRGMITDMVYKSPTIAEIEVTEWA